jgi:rhodanese-related sulfurtransferase
MDSKTANIHFQSRLAFETDPSDVYTDIQNGETGFVVVDTRTRETYMKGHVPGAVNLPYREVSPGSTASFAKDKLIVTYCDGVFCNASTKAAARFSALGFRVRDASRNGWLGRGRLPGGDWTRTRRTRALEI